MSGIFTRWLCCCCWWCKVSDHQEVLKTSWLHGITTSCCLELLPHLSYGMLLSLKYLGYNHRILYNPVQGCNCVYVNDFDYSVPFSTICTFCKKKCLKIHVSRTIMAFLYFVSRLYEFWTAIQTWGHFGPILSPHPPLLAVTLYFAALLLSLT